MDFLTKLFPCFKRKKKISVTVEPLAFYRFKPTQFEDEAFFLINEHRKEKGFTELILNRNILSVANTHSVDMANKNEVNHNNFYKRANKVRLFCGTDWVGECVGYGYGTPGGLVKNWIKSEEHREIIEKKKAKIGAIAVVKNNKGRNYATLILSD